MIYESKKVRKLQWGGIMMINSKNDQLVLELVFALRINLIPANWHKQHRCIAECWFKRLRAYASKLAIRATAWCFEQLPWEIILNGMIV